MRFLPRWSVAGAVLLLVACGSSPSLTTHASRWPHAGSCGRFGDRTADTQCVTVVQDGTYSVHARATGCDGVTLVLRSLAEGLDTTGAGREQIAAVRGASWRGSATVTLTRGLWIVDDGLGGAASACRWQVDITPAQTRIGGRPMQPGRPPAVVPSGL